MRIISFILAAVVCSLSLSFSATADDLDDLLGLGGTDGTSGSLQGERKFPPVDKAFRMDARQDGGKMTLHFETLDGFFLYKSRFSARAENAVLGKPVFPKGVMHDDPDFGRQEVFEHSADIVVPIEKAGEDAVLTVRYQGCTEGLCYPPVTKKLPLEKTGSDAASEQPAAGAGSTEPAAAGESDDSAKEGFSLISEETDAIKNRGLAGMVLLFLALGFGLAFTPCVFPMYPILTTIVLGSTKQKSAGAFALSMSYVQGMAVTYTVLGILISMAGARIHSFLQQPLVLGIFSVIFIVLALSMFGFFSFALPASFTSRMQKIADAQKSGSFIGAFVLGTISALVCSPCTTAPLSGVLLYLAERGDPLRGAAALYALGFGMGIPMLLIGTFGKKILPKSGSWLGHVEYVFGWLMLLVPAVLLGRVNAFLGSVIFWTVAATGIIMTLSRLLMPGIRRRFQALLALAVGAVTASVLVIALPQEAAEKNAIATEAELEALLRGSDGRTVMIDFYADWCVSCKEYDVNVFARDDVKKALEGIRIVRVDLTDFSDKADEITSRWNIKGLPTIVFTHGSKETFRIEGYLESGKFLEKLRSENVVLP